MLAKSLSDKNIRIVQRACLTLSTPDASLFDVHIVLIFTLVLTKTGIVKDYKILF